MNSLNNDINCCVIVVLLFNKLYIYSLIDQLLLIIQMIKKLSALILIYHALYSLHSVYPSYSKFTRWLLLLHALSFCCRIFIYDFQRRRWYWNLWFLFILSSIRWFDSSRLFQNLFYIRYRGREFGWFFRCYIERIDRTYLLSCLAMLSM